jgi:hypothetical protein
MAQVGELVIKFSSDRAAAHFKSWLDGQGEQDYWTWMECREEEEKGDITATRFHYSGEKNVITTTCGRMRKE